MNRLRPVCVLSVLVLLLPQVSLGAGKTIKDDTVTISLGEEPETMDPHTSSSALGTTIHRYVFDTLMHRPKGAVVPEPWAAKSFKWIDSQTIEFSMREGVKFTNGEDVDGEAVKFSLTRPLGQGFKTVQSRLFREIDRIEVPGKWVARIHLKAPFPGILTRFSDWGNLVPPKYYARISQEEASVNPIGSGPYRLVRWKKGVEMLFEANPDYWNSAYPKVRRIRVVPIREAGTSIAALLKGEVDLVNNVPAQYISRVKSNPTTEIHIVRGTRIYHLGFSHGIKSPVQDLRVRKAIAHAINRDVIVKAVVEGQGVISNQPLHEWTEGYDADRKWPYEYSLEKSKRLLAEAGYPNGFAIDFYSPAGRYTKDKEVAEALVGMLSRVGIQAKHEPLSWQTFVDRFNARTKPDAKPFLYYIGYGNGNGDTDACLNAIAACKGQWSGYCVPKFDQELDAAAATIDPKKRQGMFRAIVQAMADDVSHVFLWQENSVYGMAKRISWDVRNDDRVYAWEIDTR